MLSIHSQAAFDEQYDLRHASELAILLHRAAQGWTIQQTAKRFHLTPETITRWMHDLEQEGSRALTRTHSAVNKYPDFVEYISHYLKTYFPSMGKRTIAEHFARCGAHLSATTVGRRLRTKPRIFPSDPCPSSSPDSHTVTARHPNHVWNIDLTIVPSGGGFWASWCNTALPQCWPFCWWVLVILDHYSRKCLAFAVFPGQPSARDTIRVIDKATRHHGKPKHMISDNGTQFWPSRAKTSAQAKNHPYHVWCSKKQIRTRFGAVGKHGSIAIVERFIKTLKDEGTRRIVVPLNFDAMRHERSLIVGWYNLYRPHSALTVRTPEEVWNHSPPKAPLPIARMCDLPTLVPSVSFLEGRKHLPIVAFDLAA
ncbi:MAG: DDE-type integrase/transposase/recombinase [Kiritimatiellia bacterium]|jgi:transposase InsO family protein|nr:DDE-type integrase/transposase/recombinase [Kiritimatiellia bacterium]